MEHFRRRKRFWLLLGIVALAMGSAMILLRWYESTLPLEVHARRAARAVLKGDVRTAWRYTIPEENERIGITEEKFREIFATIVRPALRPYQLQHIETDVTSDEAAAMALCLLRDSEGNEFEFPLKVYRTSDGAGYDVNSLIVVCWYAEAAARSEPLNTKEDLTRARVEGLKRSISLFQRLQLRGLAPYPGAEMLPWEYWLERWRQATQD